MPSSVITATVDRKANPPAGLHYLMHRSADDGDNGQSCKPSPGHRSSALATVYPDYHLTTTIIVEVFTCTCERQHTGVHALINPAEAEVTHHICLAALPRSSTQQSSGFSADT